MFSRNRLLVLFTEKTVLLLLWDPIEIGTKKMLNMCQDKFPSGALNQFYSFYLFMYFTP